MSHVVLDRRAGRLRLYLGGELQFDAADERRYHEPLALVPLALARARAPGRALRVTILGGGDGLALREVLRVPEVAEVHLVDRDPAVLALGRGALARLNRGAFADARVRVDTADARDAVGAMRERDVIVCDLTYPRDPAGAAVHALPFYRAVRAALRPDGVLAVNAVSPELTPEAFGCLAATLGAAGLASMGWSVDLPSFAAEGYGRWGFLFASVVPIADAELRGITLPAAAGLTPAAVLAGTAFPAAAGEALRGAAANRSDEILYYLANAAPVRWTAPFAPFRRAPGPAGPGPRLTVAEGFARWLAEPDGRRTLDTLLACVPVGRRGPARARVEEWAAHAERAFRQVDLRAFVERALRRAAALPEGWRRELGDLAARLRAGVPTMRELVHVGWRVFAVFLLAMLLADLLFPDNLYAKGTFGTHRSSSSGGGQEVVFSAQPVAPFRQRRRPGPVVSDAWGRDFPSTRVTLADAAGARRAVPAVLALRPDLRLLEGGAIAYFAPLMGHHLVLHPDRLDVLTSGGDRLLALHPGAVADEVAPVLGAQAPLLARAIEDHRRWLAWARWGAGLAGGGDPGSEMAELERIAAALDAARAEWSVPLRAAAFRPGTGWRPVVPGLWVRPGREAGTREAVLVDADGVPEVRRILPPPAAPTDVDRFVFSVLAWRAPVDRDLQPVVRAWLGQRAATPEAR